MLTGEIRSQIDKEVVHEEVEHMPPQQILATLAELESKIQHGMEELKGMLK